MSKFEPRTCPQPWLTGCYGLRLGALALAAPSDVQALVAEADLTDARMILAGVRNDPGRWNDIEDIDLEDI